MKRIFFSLLLFFCVKNFAQQEAIVPLPAMILNDDGFFESWLVPVHDKKHITRVPLNSLILHGQKEQSVLALRTQFVSNNHIITLSLIGDVFGYELSEYKKDNFENYRKIPKKFKTFFCSLDLKLKNLFLSQNTCCWFFDACEFVYSQQNTICWNNIDFDSFENVITIEQKGVLDTLHEDDKICMVINCYDYLILWLEMTQERIEERDGEVDILSRGWHVKKVTQEGGSLILQELFDFQLLAQIIGDQNNYELKRLSNVLKHPTENKLLFEFLGDDDYLDDDYLYVVYDLDAEHVLRSWFSDCSFAWQKDLASQAQFMSVFAGKYNSEEKRKKLATTCCGALVDLTPGQVDLEDNT